MSFGKVQVKFILVWHFVYVQIKNVIDFTSFPVGSMFKTGYWLVLSLVLLLVLLLAQNEKFSSSKNYLIRVSFEHANEDLRFIPFRITTIDMFNHETSSQCPPGTNVNYIVAIEICLVQLFVCKQYLFHF